MKHKDPKDIDWAAAEQLVAGMPGWHDIFPNNVREWDKFIKQYSRIVQFVNDREDPTYVGLDKDGVDELKHSLLLGLGYKKSPLEVYKDFFQYVSHGGQLEIHPRSDEDHEIEHLYAFEKIVPMRPIVDVIRFFMIAMSCAAKKYAEAEWKPKHVVNFEAIGWKSPDGTLKDMPRSARNYNCSGAGIKTLKGGPTHIGAVFNCADNELTSLEHAPFFGSMQVDGTITGASVAASNNKISLLCELRGEVNYLDLSSNRIESLKNFPKCRIADLTYNDVSDANELRHIPKEVERIHLMDNPMMGEHENILRRETIDKILHKVESERIPPPHVIDFEDTTRNEFVWSLKKESSTINKTMKKFEHFIGRVNESKKRHRIHKLGEFLNEAHDFPTMTYHRASSSRSTDFVSVGTTPSEEDCAQANPDNTNVDLMSRQCVAYINQLVRMYGEAPGNAYWFILKNYHEFGEYLEAALMYNPDREDESEYAMEVESGAENWDPEALKELDTDMPKNESWRPKLPIIGDAVAMLKDTPGAMKVSTKSEYESATEKQKYFSASHSHCFRDKEEYDFFHKNGSKYMHKSSENSDILHNVGDLVAVWDDENGVGYYLPAKKNESAVNEMATVKGQKPGYSLNIQHEFLTLKTPYGNYTTSYSGEKMSGQLVTIPGAFKRCNEYIAKFFADNKGKNNQDAMVALMNDFEKVVPEVADLGETQTLEPGDVVRFKDGHFKKKYPGEYVIDNVKKSSAFVRLDGGGLMGFPVYSMEKTGEKKEIDLPTKVSVGDTAVFVEPHDKKYPGEFKVLRTERDKVVIEMNGRPTRCPANMLKKK